MNFDINEVIADMAGAIKGEVGDAWSEVQSVANQFLTKRKERLALLAELTITGDITIGQLELRLKHEQLLAEAEFHAIAVISKAIAQRAANAAMDVLKTAVQTAIGAAL
jgi:hypothetical protein